MAKKICRTCLKYTVFAFKSHEMLSNPGEQDKIKISDVLRYLVPELYLGVTTSPEICTECRGALKLAYNFRKKCLETENLIGTYLKNARFTAKSIDLYDVLEFVGKQSKPKSLEAVYLGEEAVESNAQQIISDWQDDGSEESNLEVFSVNDNNTKVETKPENVSNIYTKTKVEVKSDKVNQICSITNVETRLEDINKLCTKPNVEAKSQNEGINSETILTTSKENSSTTEEKPYKEKIRVRTNLFHIDNVFTLFDDEFGDDLKNGNETNEREKQASKEITSNVLEHSISPEENKTIEKLLQQPKIILPQNQLLNPDIVLKKKRVRITANASKQPPSDKQIDFNVGKNLIDIKEEPLDLERLEDLVDSSILTSDEDTLTAPESAEYDSIQGLINRIPETYNNQYVDIPDFVHISNFSLSDFENLRKCQQPQMVNCSTNQFMPLQTSTFSVAGGTLLQTNQNTILQTVINDNTIIAPNNSFAIANLDLLNNPGNHTKVFPSKLPTVFLSPVPVQATPKPNIICPRPRKRRRIKLIPVADIEGDVKEGVKPHDTEKDVCVLFTNYTIDGIYVNDHDYLAAPYKRNKVLLKDNENWVCMCYICGSKHPVDEHVSHMILHDPTCILCKANLGTPYMLNMHMRTHEKPCKFCTENVQLTDKEQHELKHLEEERTFDTERRKLHHLSKRGRKKLNKSEKTIYSPNKLIGSDSDKEGPAVSLLKSSSTNESKSEQDSTQPEPKRPRGRKRGIEHTEPLDINEGLGPPAQRRILRSNLKKTETDNKKSDLIQ